MYEQALTEQIQCICDVLILYSWREQITAKEIERACPLAWFVSKTPANDLALARILWILVVPLRREDYTWSPELGNDVDAFHSRLYGPTPGCRDSQKGIQQRLKGRLGRTSQR